MTLPVDAAGNPDPTDPRPALRLPGIACPVLGFAGWSGAGKTTLLETLIPLLIARGLRIGVIKHAHHRVDVDRPGKDSHRLRNAGANQVLLSSDVRRALLVERREPGPAQLLEELGWIDQTRCDLILVEGFRDQPLAKVEVFRQALERPVRYTEDTTVIALACAPFPPVIPCHDRNPPPCFDLNQPESLATYIVGLLD